MKIDDLRGIRRERRRGLSRCLNNEEFYLKLVGSMRDEDKFDALESAIEDGRLDDAFEAAHALKGVLGNLSITPLYEPVAEITELLRARTDMDYSELMGKIAISARAFPCAFKNASAYGLLIAAGGRWGRGRAFPHKFCSGTAHGPPLPGGTAEGDRAWLQTLTLEWF